MSLGGLITGALSGATKAYGQVAEGELKKKQELDLRRQISDMEMEKQLRIDEIRRGRDIEDIGRRTQAEADAAPIAAKGKVAAEAATLGAATAAGLPEKKAAYERTAYDASKPLEEQRARDKVALETKLTVEQVNTPGYLQAVAKKARAGHVESAGSLAQAALANFKLGREKSVAGLQDALAKETDPTKREQITQKIRDTSGGSSTKSFADVVAMGNGYVNMAAKLRNQAKDSMDPEEASALNAQAAAYEQAADQVFKSVGEKRLGPGATDPKTGPPFKQQPAKPIDLNQFFNTK